MIQQHVVSTSKVWNLYSMLRHRSSFVIYLCFIVFIIYSVDVAYNFFFRVNDFLNI